MFNFFSIFYILFSFLHRHDEAFSTEPMHSNGSSHDALVFNYIQELKTTANSAFVHYLQHFPLIFEIFGHLNRSTSANVTNATLCAILGEPNLNENMTLNANELTEQSIHPPLW